MSSQLTHSAPIDGATSAPSHTPVRIGLAVEVHPVAPDTTTTPAPPANNDLDPPAPTDSFNPDIMHFHVPPHLLHYIVRPSATPADLAHHFHVPLAQIVDAWITDATPLPTVTTTTITTTTTTPRHVRPRPSCHTSIPPAHHQPIAHRHHHLPPPMDVVNHDGPSPRALFAALAPRLRAVATARKRELQDGQDNILSSLPYTRNPRPHSTQHSDHAPVGRSGRPIPPAAVPGDHDRTEQLPSLSSPIPPRWIVPKQSSDSMAASKDNEHVVVKHASSTHSHPAPGLPLPSTTAAAPMNRNTSSPPIEDSAQSPAYESCGWWRAGSCNHNHPRSRVCQPQASTVTDPAANGTLLSADCFVVGRASKRVYCTRALASVVPVHLIVPSLPRLQPPALSPTSVSTDSPSARGSQPPVQSHSPVALSLPESSKSTSSNSSSSSSQTAKQGYRALTSNSTRPSATSQEPARAAYAEFRVLSNASSVCIGVVNSALVQPDKLVGTNPADSGAVAFHATGKLIRGNAEWSSYFVQYRAGDTVGVLVAPVSEALTARERGTARVSSIRHSGVNSEQASSLDSARAESRGTNSLSTSGLDSGTDSDMESPGRACMRSKPHTVKVSVTFLVNGIAGPPVIVETSAASLAIAVSLYSNDTKVRACCCESNWRYFAQAARAARPAALEAVCAAASTDRSSVEDDTETFKAQGTPSITSFQSLEGAWSRVPKLADVNRSIELDSGNCSEVNTPIR